MIFSDITDLPTDLVSLVYDYIPDEDPLQVSARGEIISDDPLLDISLGRITSLDTVVKNNPQYYAWFAKHHNVKSLHLSFANVDNKTIKEMVQNLLPSIRSFSHLISLYVKCFSNQQKIITPLFDSISDLTIENSRFAFDDSFDNGFLVSPNLTSLTLLGVGINSLFASFLTRLNQNPHLTKISIGTWMPDEVFAELIRLLAAHLEVESLEFSLIDIDHPSAGRLFEEFLVVLPRLTRLTSLDISINGFPQFPIEKFNDSLQSLSQLTRANIRIFNENSPRDLFESFPNLTCLSVGLGDNVIFDTIITFLETHPHLQDFKFSLRKTDMNQIARMMPLLNEIVELETLDLNFYIQPEDRSKEISLGSFPRLKYLALGGFAVSEISLAQMPNLEYLDISRITVSIQTYQKILLALRNHPYLKSLMLPQISSEEMFDECLATLAELPYLETLEIAGLDIEVSAYRRLFAILSDLTHLRQITLPPDDYDEENAISQEGFEILQEYEELKSHLPDYL